MSIKRASFDQLEAACRALVFADKQAAAQATCRVCGHADTENVRRCEAVVLDLARKLGAA